MRPPTDLRGSAKLAAALDRFGVDVDGRVALDVGAAAGGFTSVLLGAGRDPGLRASTPGTGSCSARCARTSGWSTSRARTSATSARSLVPEPVAIVTIDVSYLSLAAAIPAARRRIDLAPGCDLVALVKPMFELGLADRADRRRVARRGRSPARRHARSSTAGWDVARDDALPGHRRQGRRRGLHPCELARHSSRHSAESACRQNDQPVASSVGSADGSVTTSATAACALAVAVDGAVALAVAAGLGDRLVARPSTRRPATRRGPPRGRTTRTPSAGSRAPRSRSRGTPRCPSPPGSACR